MNSLQIHIYRDGKQTGPYSVDEIRAHLRSGALVPSDLAWHEGAPEWVPLSSILGLSLPPQLPHTASIMSPAVRPAKRGWIVLGAVGSGFFSLIILVVTLLWFVDTGGEKHKSILPLFLGLFATGVGICFSVQLLGSLRRRTEGHCELCRRAVPTIRVSINRHIGAIILMFHRSLSGSFCKPCIARAFKEYTLMTLFLGWWGMLSFFITPIVLINNVIVYVRSQFMPPGS